MSAYASRRVFEEFASFEMAASEGVCTLHGGEMSVMTYKKFNNFKFEVYF